MQKKDKARKVAKTHDQIMKEKKDMALPINRFMNTFNEDGTPKFPVAQLFRNYVIVNPDPVLGDMRMINALLHELRFHKNSAVKYLFEHEREGAIELLNNQGKAMTKEECYLNYISESHQVHTVLSKLRQSIITSLLSKCDDVTLTLEQYNTFVEKVIKVVSDLGYELFPEQVTLIEPL